MRTCVPTLVTYHNARACAARLGALLARGLWWRRELGCGTPEGVSCIRASPGSGNRAPPTGYIRSKNRDSGKLSQQRTTLQIKGRDKTPGEELSKVENFPDGQWIGICLPTHVGHKFDP